MTGLFCIGYCDRPQKLFVMAQVATAAASGALHALSSPIGGTTFKTPCVSVSSWKSQPKRSLAVRAAGESENANVGFANRSETGIVFEPFTEVQSQLVQVPTSYSESLARQRYSPSCEAAINDQIKYGCPLPFVSLLMECVGLPSFTGIFWCPSLNSIVLLTHIELVEVFNDLSRFMRAVWSTTCHTSTTPYSPISIVTMSHFQDLPSESQLRTRQILHVILLVTLSF